MGSTLTRRHLAAAAIAAVNQPATAASRQPSASRIAGTLTFDDDFDTFNWNETSATATTPATPTGRWATRYWWGDGARTLPSNAERQYYSDRSVGVHPFRIADGVLEIAADRSADPASTDGLPYTSGMITTEGTFAQRYGHFEMRARLPRGRGLWPAFWLLPQDHTWPPELDIMEVLGHEPTRFFGSVHSVETGERRSLVMDAEVDDLAGGFHSFAVSWRPDRIVWYVDGLAVLGTPTPADMHKPMYMLANLAVGGGWPGEPDHATRFPATFAIDRIRVHQFDDLEAMPPHPGRDRTR